MIREYDSGGNIVAVELLLQRMDHTEKSSYGVLFNHLQEQIAFVIEDIPREVKVENETRFGAGCYQIKLKEVLTPMTKRYRKKFDWFTWHLELQGILDFTNVYLHIGNKASDSSGCGLVNNGVQLVNNEYVGLSSTSCFEKVYLYIKELLDNGVEVWLRVQDEDSVKLPF